MESVARRVSAISGHPNSTREKFDALRATIVTTDFRGLAPRAAKDPFGTATEEIIVQKVNHPVRRTMH